MKQIIQDLKSGKTKVLDVPIPNLKKNHIQIQTNKSLISAGTEKMLIEFGKANYLNKIRLQPEKFKQAINKLKTDGIKPTLDAIFNKLEQPLPLGYCNVGEIVASDTKIKNFNVGDRVVSNGFHAEIVNSPFNLSAKIPDNVSDEEAVYSILGSIALQGIRMLNPTLGETIAVFGCGSVGLITTQLLIANGCNVMAIDFDKNRLEIAKSYGADIFHLSNSDQLLNFSNNITNNNGFDGVILTLSTKSNEPIHQAAQISRKRGKIILVGDCGLKFSRQDFYKKELSFQVSSSYGPGRYESKYENEGLDYPIGFVRWTANRNITSFLNLLSKGKVDVKRLTSHTFNIEEAEKAYELLTNNNNSLGIIINYNSKSNLNKEDKTVKLQSAKTTIINNNFVTNFIGSGNYSSKVLMPLFKKNKFNLNNISSESGLSSTFNGKKHGFNNSTTDFDKIFKDNSDILVIASRHDTHSKFLIEGINHNKHIFLEKPLCINLQELEKIIKTYHNNKNYLNKILLVGYNRRFSKFAKKIHELISDIKAPKSFVMTINAGKIDKESWVLDKKIGGGRLIGECCHFIDLLRFLSGSKIKNSFINSYDEENFIINLKFNDDSIGTINYFADGSIQYPKEKLDIFVDGKILHLDNFKKLNGYGWKNFKKMTSFVQDKGQENCIKSFKEAILNNEKSPISFEELLEVAKISLNLSTEL